MIRRVGVFERLVTAGRSLRVLLVDRDTDTCSMYAEYLQLAGCAVVEASDGPEALAKAIASRPDVVIMETRLSGFTGYELCALLRRDVATQTAIIIVVTGDGFATDVDRAFEAGADSVLIKPCLPDQLVSEVRRLLTRAPQRSATDRRHTPASVSSAAPDKMSRGVGSRAVKLTYTQAPHETMSPPLAPPRLVCPSCGRTLEYRRSQIGGVSARNSEQWDYFDCVMGCGTFEYRQRTRKLRRVP